MERRLLSMQILSSNLIKTLSSLRLWVQIWKCSIHRRSQHRQSNILGATLSCLHRQMCPLVPITIKIFIISSIMRLLSTQQCHWNLGTLCHLHQKDIMILLIKEKRLELRIDPRTHFINLEFISLHRKSQLRKVLQYLLKRSQTIQQLLLNNYSNPLSANNI